VSGLELERAYVGNSSMAEIVPAGSAVYAWRRKFRAPPGIAADPVALASWIAATTKTPSAILPEKELSHYLLLHGISIGGAALTESKLLTLATWAAEPKSRHWLLSMVESIGALAPPLYIGETDNLARRVKDHLGDKTDFSNTLLHKLKLTWQDCELNYCPVPAELLTTDAKDRRTLVELVVARLTVAGCTSRPG
jgi:hypothetical protein